jgi:Outer membrane protein beta-barrel family/Carboxypeptidase regulatory-like domain
MKRNHPIFILFLFLSFPLFSQKNTVVGAVADSTGTGLPSATVVLLQKQDSVLSSFGITNDDGRFQLKRVKPGEYLLQVSYVGFATHYQPLTVAENAGLVDAGTVSMEAASANLDAVEVVGEHVPMRFKRDTIEYNAAAFKTQDGDVVEELLKKLPGVEVERDGTIRAQGEQVQNVLVDGKEFFGNDPTIATKNLPADAVDKVQVYDKKSEKAEFTGIEDGRDEKTINLALKEDKKQGYFGKATAGYGSGDRYAGKFNINRFSKNTQLSAIGMGNNTNEAGFSFNDYMQFMGGLSNLMSGGGGGRGIRLSFDPGGLPIGNGLSTGINTTWAGGLNFNREFGDKTELNGSYFFNRIENDLGSEVTSENLLGDASYNSGENEERYSKNENHRLNMTLRHEIDSFQNIVLRSRFSTNDAIISSDGTSFSETTGGLPGNSGLRQYRSTGENFDLSSNFSYRRRFRKKGRSFVTDLAFGKNNNDRRGNIYSLNSFYDDGIPAFTDTLHQRQGYTDDATSYGATLSYSEPLGKKNYLEFQISRQNYDNQTVKDYFDINGSGGELRNDTLSTGYDRGYLYDRGGLNFTINRRKYSLTAGAALQRSTLEGQLEQETPLGLSFTRLLPNLFFDYEFGTSRNLNIEYQTSVREPSLEQLQPVVDNSDPLNTYTGNPGLRPEYAHNMSAHYMLFDQFSFTSFFASVDATYTKDRITNASTIDAQLQRNTMPVNVDHDFSLRSYASFSTPLRFIKTNIRLNYSNNWNRGILFVNQDKNNTSRLTNTVDLSLDNRKKDIVDARIGVRISHNKTTYSVSDALNQTYLDRRYYAGLRVTPTKKWTFGSEFDYTIYPAESFGLETKIPIWQASISRYFLKGNRGQLRLSAFDILGKNLGISRTNQLNYVQEERIRSLSRYVMLSFSYSISGFGKAGEGGFHIEIDEMN